MQLELTCSICRKSGDKMTKDCYNGTLIGPEIEPGLVLGSNHGALYVFYGELKPAGHIRVYEWERVDVEDNGVLPWLWGKTHAHDIEKMKNLGQLRKANDIEVQKLSSMIKKGVRMSSLIKVVMERKGIKELHNRTDYFD